MRFSLTTLGCKVNSYESQYYVEQLKEQGYQYDEKNPDICIINTCAVTNTAAQKSRQKIHKSKREHPNAYIVVVGCLGQFMDKEKREELDVDCWIGAKHKNELPQRLKEMIDSKETVDCIEPITQTVDFESMPIHFFENQHRAFLKVQDGCNQYCSYCAIPYARGAERSLQTNQAVQIAKELSNQGHKEIVLTGIHTGRYQDGQTTLAGLLKVMLDETPEDVYYRISSIEINEVTDELLELMKEQPRICRHLHIPIQSGCNETLKRMNRPYTIEQFKQRLDVIRAILPDCSISSDVIAGFVSETQEEFDQTVQTMNDCAFSFLHVFPYSKRDKTVAANMKDEISGSIKKERVSQLLKMSTLLRIQDMKRFTEIEVFIERKKGNLYTGYTNQYHPVFIESDRELKGRIRTTWDSIDEKGYWVKDKGEFVCD